MGSNEAIQQGSQVTLHFALHLANGEEVDSNFRSKPATFRLGDGSMLPGFEAVLLGLRQGDEKEVKLPAAEAFGEVNPKNRQRFPVDKFAHLLEDELMPAEVGSVVTFKDPAGYDLPGVVTEIGAGIVGVDFNHPLAGKEIIFTVSILSVLAPTVAAVELKL